MTNLQRAWRYLLAEPFTWLFYAFFKRVISIVRLYHKFRGSGGILFFCLDKVQRMNERM